MDNKTNIVKKIRIGTQTIFGILLAEFALYGIVRCPYAIPYTDCTYCPVIQCPGRKYFLPLWIAIFTSAIIFARSFCGWICPFGTLTDILNKIKILRIKLSKQVSSVLSYGKYLFLAFAITYVFYIDNPRLAIPIRTGDFFNSIKLTFEHADNLWIIRSVFIILGVLLSLLISKFWCRFICPNGGIMEILAKISLFRISKNNKCNDCNVCKEECKTDTRPDEENCVSCFVCNELCIEDAIDVTNIKINTDNLRVLNSNLIKQDAKP